MTRVICESATCPTHYRFYDDALYRYTFYLLTYKYDEKVLRR